MKAALCVVLLLVSGCPYKVPFHDYAKEPDPRGKELVLGVGDSVVINVWEQRDLTTEATIRADGFITMPLVGNLKAAGETPSALTTHIKSKLGAFLKIQEGTEPVTVRVTQWRSYRFTVEGEVTRQNTYQSDQWLQVSHAIAMAGGLTRFADRARIKLYRADPQAAGGKRVIPLDYDAIVSGKRLDMDIWILPGDVIYVP